MFIIFNANDVFLKEIWSTVNYTRAGSVEESLWYLPADVIALHVKVPSQSTAREKFIYRDPNWKAKAISLKIEQNNKQLQMLLCSFSAKLFPELDILMWWLFVF